MHPHLQHRGGLAYMVGRLKPDPTLFGRVGGQSFIDALVDGLYDGIESDDQLLPLFRHDLAQERENQKQFFARWMGGDTVYDGYRGVRARHRDKVTKDGARRWLGHFTASAKKAKLKPALLRELMEVVVPLAQALVDDKPMLQCQAWYRKPAADVAKGSLSLTQRWIDDNPELLEDGPSQLLMHQAARRGRLDIVRYLHKSGVDVNLPDCTQSGLAVTPLCMALSQKHEDVSAYLKKHGAKTDVFTLAWLGDLDGLKEILEESPELLDIQDPAQDFQEVTPLEHALYRNKLKVAKHLLEHGASLRKGQILLDRAISKGRTKIVELLLSFGVSTEGVGPGRWLMDEKLSILLKSHGASIDGDESDWIEFCTGHHGNREDAEFVARLLDEGVKLQGRDHKGRTALHCATRVGYLSVMKLLLERGIPANEIDNEGNTPLHYVSRARAKVDREAVAELLLKFGADPKLENDKGQSAALE